MFLLVSVCHVGAHPGKHQHGVSIQISISLGKTFLRISCIRKIPLTWILMRVFVYVPPFISQILDFIYWTVLIFILMYFEWRDKENQQFLWLIVHPFLIQTEVRELPQIFARFSVHTMIALLILDVLLHKVEIKLQVRQKGEEGMLPCFQASENMDTWISVCRTVNKTLFCFFYHVSSTDFEGKIEGL